MVVEDLIVRLRIEDWRQVFQEDNQLLFNDLWENLIKQLTKSHNKNQNILLRDLVANTLSTIRLDIKQKIVEISLSKVTLRNKGQLKPMPLRLMTFRMKC